MVPVVIFGSALVLLVLDSGNTLAWTVVCVGGFAVLVHGLVIWLDLDMRLDVFPLFRLYVALLGLWMVLEKRRAVAAAHPGSVAPTS